MRFALLKNEFGRTVAVNLERIRFVKKGDQGTAEVMFGLSDKLRLQSWDDLWTAIVRDGGGPKND